MDKEEVLKAIRTSTCAILVSRPNIKINYNLMKVSSKVLDDPEVVDALIDCDARPHLTFLSKKYRNDKERISKVVAKHGETLKYASLTLRDDKDVVLKAVSNNWNAFTCASTRLQSDVDIINAAIANNGIVLQYLSGESRSTKEIVMQAVTSNGLALQYVYDVLCQDIDVVRAAVTSNGMALQYASPHDKKFQNDEEIVKIAIEKDPYSIRFASSRIKNNKIIALLVLQYNGNTFKYIPSKFKKCRDYVLASLYSDIPNREYIHIPKNFLHEKDISKRLLTIRKDWYSAIYYFPYEFKDDHDIMMIAVDDPKWGFNNLKLMDRTKIDKYIVMKCLSNYVNDEKHLMCQLGRYVYASALMDPDVIVHLRLISHKCKRNCPMSILIHKLNHVHDLDITISRMLVQSYCSLFYAQ